MSFHQPDVSLPHAGFTSHGVSNFRLRSRVFTLAPYHNSGFTRSKLQMQQKRRTRILSDNSSSVVANTVNQTFDEPAHKR